MERHASRGITFASSNWSYRISHLAATGVLGADKHEENEPAGDATRSRMVIALCGVSFGLLWGLFQAN